MQHRCDTDCSYRYCTENVVFAVDAFQRRISVGLFVCLLGVIFIHEVHVLDIQFWWWTMKMNLTWWMSINKPWEKNCDRTYHWYPVQLCDSTIFELLLQQYQQAPGNAIIMQIVQSILHQPRELSCKPWSHLDMHSQLVVVRSWS